MDSASLQFIFFGLAAALLSNISRARVWRSVVLMATSLVFIGLLAHSYVVLLPLAGFLVLGYVALTMIQRGWSRLLPVALLVVIGAYVWLKKYTFLPEASLLHSPYFTLGLSYIFFRVLHLLIQAGDENPPRLGPFAYLLYTINFTTFLSGPIQRYDEFAEGQFTDQPIALGPRVIGLQLERIIRGFFKVNVLGMLFQVVQQDAILQLSESLPIEAKLLAGLRLIVVYPFFLYCNFSGYIDIVIALARLMRLPLPENFDRPFSSSSFLDFWSRWHITLSLWLKTYVYNPLLLALMRRISVDWLQPFLGVFCFFVTFFLVGVWHGRTSEFIVFGLLQGGGVAINKLWQIELARFIGRKRYKALADQAVYVAFGRGLTFTWFAFTLFWFWGTWKQIDAIFSSLSLAQWLLAFGAVWVVMTVVLALWEAARAAILSVGSAEGPAFTSRYARVVYASALGLIALVLTVLLNQPAPGIVYKAF